ncbi:MAG: hypothetical protein HC802_23605 [Caldilineaceae bacterium]|nr:hypothetical protein [Caldilineaceae bacterium]
MTPDLTTPPATNSAPAPALRVRQTIDDYAGSDVYHLLYLPTNWEVGKTFPVIVEYAGNQYKTCPGTVEGSNLGYGISGGVGAIWVCMPYVNIEKMENQLTWWGDVDATVDYCQKTVHHICATMGGDRENVFLAGFSRGAIACNFIGLHDDAIASLWRGFICHSHYDGVKEWPYPGSDRAAAAERLRRLGSRPQFISHESSVEATRSYLMDASPDGNFTFLSLPFPEHTDAWVLQERPEREMLRDWFNAELKLGVGA